MTQHRLINSAFRDCYRAATSKGTIGFLSDWPMTDLARTMNAGVVRVTPLMVGRLANLARALNYSGPVFEDA